MDNQNITNNSTALGSRKIALCSIMAALGTVIMLTGGLIPIFTYCSPLIAALLLIPVCEEAGKAYSWMVWLVTAVLSLLTGIDKEASFFYLFLGFYPIIKPALDRIPVRLLRFAAKCFLFTACVCAMYGIICFIFKIDDIINSFTASRWLNIGILAAIVLCMLIYDKALYSLTAYYHVKLKPKLSRSIKRDTKKSQKRR